MPPTCASPLSEVAAYLNDVAALELTPADIAALEKRTEGWIAALQLAALSLRGRADTGSFIAAFAGDDRYIVDYLAEEVLNRQPSQVRDFLLETSILDRLSGPLCEAVTGNTESQEMLEHLDRANLFLVPLDGTRRWYRYHHLFAEVLGTHLLHGRPEEVADLHRRASRWYDEAGDPVPAVRHAVAAGDIDRAADLAELAMPALQRDRQEATIAAWLAVIPDEVVHKRPVLALGFIGALMSSGQFAVSRNAWTTSSSTSAARGPRVKRAGRRRDGRRRPGRVGPAARCARAVPVRAVADPRRPGRGHRPRRPGHLHRRRR